MFEQEHTAYLGLGSNLGDKQTKLLECLRRLGEKPGIKITKLSSIYRTSPVGVSRQPDFYNAAVEIKTTLSPLSLLKAVKSIEYEMGREPNSHFRPRPIDIDILLYGDQEVDTLELLIPHSRLTSRAFVLIPLLELNPDLTHPTSFKPLKKCLDEIEPSQKVERIIDAGVIAGELEKS